MDAEFQTIYQNLLDSSQKLKAPAPLITPHLPGVSPSKVIPLKFSAASVVKVEKLVDQFYSLLDLVKRDPFQGTHLLYQSIPNLCSLIFSNHSQSWIFNCYDERDKESLLDLLEIEGAFFTAIDTLSQNNTSFKFQVDSDKLPTPLLDILTKPSTSDPLLSTILPKLQLQTPPFSLFLNPIQYYLLSFLLSIYRINQQPLTLQAEPFTHRIVANLTNSYCQSFLPQEAPSDELKLTCDFFNALLNHLFILPHIDSAISDPLPPSEYFPSILPNNKLPPLLHIKVIQQLTRYIAHPHSYSNQTFQNSINFIKTSILHWPNCEQYYNTIGIYQYLSFPWRLDNATVTQDDCQNYIQKHFIIYTDIFRLYLNRSRHLPLGVKGTSVIETKLVKALKTTIEQFLFDEFYTLLYETESDLIKENKQNINPCYTESTPPEVTKLLTQMESNLHNFKNQPILTMNSLQSFSTLTKDDLLKTIRDIKAIFSIDFEKSFYEPKVAETAPSKQKDSTHVGGRSMFIYWTITKPLVNDEQKHQELGVLMNEFDEHTHTLAKPVYGFLISLLGCCFRTDLMRGYQNYLETRWINFIIFISWICYHLFC